MRLTTGAVAVATTAVLLATMGAPARAGLPTEDRTIAEAPRTVKHTVTADQLGPDSTMVVVSRGDPFHPRARGQFRSLEVITADGTRHPLWTVELGDAPTRWLEGHFSMADWSPQRHTALLRVALRGMDKAVSYDVITGATHEVALPRPTRSVGLDPRGKGVVVATYPGDTQPGWVASISWGGTITRLPGHVDSEAITALDGHSVVTVTKRTWRVIDLATHASTSFVIRGPRCRPVRWYDHTSLIAACSGIYRSRLKRISLDGTSSALGIDHPAPLLGPDDPIVEDDDLRVVQGKTWFDSGNGCGGSLITEQTAAGVPRIIRVPGLHGGASSLVGTRGDDLVITHDGMCEVQPVPALALFNPVTRAEQVLTRLDPKESWDTVQRATEVRVW